MELHWLFALGCLCAVAAAYPASTEDPLVVTRDDDTISTELANLTVNESETTEQPLPPLKLTEMDVRSEVSMRYARTSVVTYVRNPAPKAQETIFRVLLPETAYISGFVMTLNGIPYKAYVKGKEEAKQIYDEAVAQGIGAAHVAAKARDSNEFMVQMSIEASTSAVFNLTYEELLLRRNGVYNHVINLHPGAKVPKLTVVVHVLESQALTQLRVPELRTGNEVDATDQDAQNPVAVIEKSFNGREATITFRPDLEEQARLMKVYAEKAKETQQSSSIYPVETSVQDGVLGQFVVQYDVDRPQSGDILVSDGFFVHMFAPTDLPPMKKLVVFVLDTSGSMMGRKIVQLREAMQTILSDLNEGDYFIIVEFNSIVKVHDLKEADKSEVSIPNYNAYFIESNAAPVTLLPPTIASKENIDKAKILISRLNASGGTNIASALDVAIDIVRKGVVAPLGPGETAVTGETLPTGETPPTAKTLPTGNSHVANTDTAPRTTEQPAPQIDYNYNQQKLPLEAMIVFLTDGEPTSGETNPTRIINRATEKNSGPNKATIFSLAFGMDADRSFLRKLSLRNGGFMRHIYEAADAPLQLRDFYRQISSPLLAGLQFTYPPDQVKADTLTQHQFPVYYAGSEVIVAGQVDDTATELTPVVIGYCGTEDSYTKRRYEVLPRVLVPPRRDSFFPLERLWVSLTVRQLLDRRDAADDTKLQDQFSAQAKELAIKYELVTPLTSLVVVKPNATSAVDTQSVDEKNPLQAFSAPLASKTGFVNSQAFSRMPAMPAYYGASHHALFHQYRYSQGMMSGAQIGQPGRPSLPSMNSFSGPTTNNAYITTTRAPVSDPLQAYHLQNFSWAKSLIDVSVDALVLQVNGTTVNLKLTKDTAAPASAGGDVACGAAIDGAAGVCVYLTRCAAAILLSPQSYTGFYCAVEAGNLGYAGVCCPADSVEQPRPSPLP